MTTLLATSNHRDISISLIDRDGEELGLMSNDENAPPLSPCIPVKTRSMSKRQDCQSGLSEKR